MLRRFTRFPAWHGQRRGTNLPRVPFTRRPLPLRLAARSARARQALPQRAHAHVRAVARFALPPRARAYKRPPRPIVRANVAVFASGKPPPHFPCFAATAHRRQATSLSFFHYAQVLGNRRILVELTDPPGHRPLHRNRVATPRHSFPFGEQALRLHPAFVSVYRRLPNTLLNMQDSSEQLPSFAVDHHRRDTPCRR
jgi:hypothetical protein